MNNPVLKFFVLAIFALVAIGPISAFAQENRATEINFFYSATCPHCAEAEKFLSELNEKYPEIKINKYEFSKNINLIQDFYNNYDVPAQERGYVPIIFTPDKYFIGFGSQIADDIEECIEQCVLGQGGQDQGGIKIPILGNIDVKNFSLPVLSAVLGFFDGFNVCSLASLVLILGIVISMGSKKKVLLFGGTFVVITIIIYWLLIFLWHRLFVFMAPYIRSLEIAIGLLAAFGAWYFFKEFINLTKRGPTCKFNSVADSLSGKLQNVFKNNSGTLAIIVAVLLFAGAITIIEFPCSAVIPVLFSGVLAKASVPFYMSMIYMGIFVFFYMLDEIIVLLIAAFTMKIWIASGKFMKWMSFVTGLMMAFFAFYYLLLPFMR